MMSGGSSLVAVRPASFMLITNSSFNSCKHFCTPAAPADARPHSTVRPNETSVAPKARACMASVPRRNPLSIDAVFQRDQRILRGHDPFEAERQRDGVESPN
jgi:hypothetical protein